MENKDSFADVAFSFVLGYAERDLLKRWPKEDKTFRFKYSFSTPDGKPEQKDPPKREKPEDVIRLETAIEQLHKLWDKWNSYHD